MILDLLTKMLLLFATNCMDQESFLGKEDLLAMLIVFGLVKLIALWMIEESMIAGILNTILLMNVILTLIVFKFSVKLGLKDLKDI